MICSGREIGEEKGKIRKRFYFCFVCCLDEASCTGFYWWLGDARSCIQVVSFMFSLVQSLSCVWIFVTPWTAACQASLSITNSRSSPKPMSLSQWCHPTISSSVVPFSSCSQSSPASGFFPMSQFFPQEELAKVLEFQLQHQSFQWTPRTDL